MGKRTIIMVAAICAVLVSVTLILIGCAQEDVIIEAVNAFAGADNQAPVLIAVTSESGSVVRLDFSEPVKVYGSSFGEYTTRADGKSIYVTLPKSLPPGEQSQVSGRVKDYAGNTCGFSVQVWGFNPRLPAIILNEFTTKGTAKSPDRTELLVKTDGNIHGMTLYSGTPEDWDARVILSDLEVREGDYVVIWWTQELPDGVQEKADGVLNICAGTSENPQSNNGTQVLCENPSMGAAVTDCVIYSNFGESHEGYGTRAALQRATWVFGSGGWTGDPVDSTSSTATRSMSRYAEGSDSGTADDWFVTVTGGSTFGGPNESEAY